jgi:hypothetical protein
MTLIALTVSGRVPMIIGDVLTTWSERGKNVEIPTFLGPIEHKLGVEQRNIPYSLKQKVYVIKDLISIALAGNVYQMTLFLKDLKDYFRFYEPTVANYEKFIQSYDLGNISNCSILVCLLESINDTAQFSYYRYGQWYIAENSPENYSIATGTGTAKFLDTFLNLNLKPSEPPHVASYLTMLSVLLTEERFTLNSIMEAWGAGYEIIWVQDKKFQKIDNLTIVIWDCNFNEDGTDLRCAPVLIFHYKYHEEILIINTFNGSEIARYGVLPLDRKKEDIDLDRIPGNVDFVSSLVISTLLIRHRDGTVSLPTLVTEPGDGVEAVKVKVENNGSSIEALLRNDVVEEMLKTIGKR